jgi:hypothetical protein
MHEVLPREYDQAGRTVLVLPQAFDGIMVEEEGLLFHGDIRFARLHSNTAPIQRVLTRLCK